MNRSPREVFLTTAIRALRGVEDALGTFGWDRHYRLPAGRSAVYSGGRSEVQLAKYQVSQGRSNDCGAYSVAAALRLIADQPPPEEHQSIGAGATISYREAVDLSNQRAILRPDFLQGLLDFLGGRATRIWPGGPTAPNQQAALAEALAAQNGVAVAAQSMRGTPADLIRFLAEPDTEVLVTIGWSKESVPEILYPEGKFKPLGDPGQFKILGFAFDVFAAHVMMLGAYDPDHKVMRDGREITVPWGFVNSWKSAGDQLFWMTEDDFQRAWRFVIPFVGRQKMTVIQKKRK